MSDVLNARRTMKGAIARNLATCCQELVEWRNTGTLKDGMVRKIAVIAELFAESDALKVVEREIEYQSSRLVAQAGTRAGVADPMPGTPAFTMAVFPAAEVPAGTELFVSPPTPPLPEFDDGFNGDNANLIGAIKALIDLDAAGALAPVRMPGHARTLLKAAGARLAALEKNPPPSWDDVEAVLRGIDDCQTSDADAWWETSTGAAFGAERVAELKKLFLNKG